MADGHDTKPEKSQAPEADHGDKAPVFDPLALLQSDSKTAQLAPKVAPEAPGPGKGAAGQVCPTHPDYEQYINQAARHIFDPKEMGDVNALMHKYDCDIQSKDDVFKYTNLALSQTGDRFNHAMPPDEAKQFERMQRGGYSGIGLEIVPTTIDGKPNPAAAVAGDHPGGATVIKKVTPGKAAEAAGLKEGDSFLKIDGKDVHSMNPGEVSDIITGGKPGTKVDIVVDRGGKPVEQIVTRQKVEMPPVVHDKTLPGGIAYIKIDNFGTQTEAQQLSDAMDRHKDAKGYIIDVRDNPGGFVDQALHSAELFVKDGVLMTTRERVDSPADKPEYIEVKYSVDARAETKQVKSPQGEAAEINARFPYKADGKPVVVLTNNMSASASEIFTGAVHDTAGDTTVGDTTYGKGIGQNIMKNMPDDGYLKVTSLRYLTPSGAWPGDADKNKIGLKPDVPTENLPYAEKGTVLDTQLSTAVSLINKKLSGK